MSFIHWFPGHMTKSLRMMEQEISVVDSVVYVLDARAPLACINPAFDKIIGQKTRLYVLNKADLIERSEADKWKKYFEKLGYSIIVTNSISKKDSQEVVKKLVELNKEKLDRFLQRGIKKTLRAMVIGIPNSGKSTLINSLVPKKKAMTGNRPGVTRGKQWVSVAPYIDLLDSPGVLYPDFSDQEKATKLALIGSVKDEVTDEVMLAAELYGFLTKNNPGAIASRYNVAEDTDFETAAAAIAVKRGIPKISGDTDLDRVAKLMIIDFRKQCFGKISLEKAND